MTPVEIAENIARLEAVAAAKGYYTPSITLRLNWIGYQLSADVETRADANSPCKNKYIHIEYADGFAKMFTLIENYISEMPSIEDAKRDAFIAAVGRLIEQGRDIGMEVEFLNPLTAMMEKLSTNILTVQPAPEMPF